MDHPVSGKLACCCFQIISTCSIWRHFTCVNCGHLGMRISDLMWHRNAHSERTGFFSSYVWIPLILFKDGASSLHTRSSKLSHIWHEKTTALGPLPARHYCGNVHFNGNRVRLRAFACLHGASAVRAPVQARPLACASFPAGGT